MPSLKPLLLLATASLLLTTHTSATTVDSPIQLPDLQINMLPIPAGSITLADPKFPDQTHKTEVTLSHFWLAETEVTQAQYSKITDKNPSYFRGPDLPMEQVSWEEAIAFCHQLTAREHAAGRLPEGYAYTLPTEAQWEYACRAGTTGDYAGDLDSLGWYGKNGQDKTHPVATKQPNAWGLYDMHGNIREWCLDFWAESYPGGNHTDYAGPAHGTRRVSRGGNWHRAAEQATSSHRGSQPQGRRDDLYGFRIALSPISELQIAMVPIPTGTFKMGNADPQAPEGERNVTEVTLSKFWLGQTEITQSQYKTVMGHASPCFQGLDLPIEQVSWNDAMEFCKKLTERERNASRLPEGYAYTLPTEAQWEYACRAGTTEDDPEAVDATAWYRENSGRETHPVGSKKPNAWGLYDMHGNVRELCLDWFNPNYSGGSVTDPQGPDSGAYRVCRGAGWGDRANRCRSAFRGFRSEDRREFLLGFRVALSKI